MFEKTDLDDLWVEGEAKEKEYYYDKDDYECGSIESDDQIKSIEKDLGFKLPESYIFLMKKHNGGLLKKTCAQINRKKRYYDIEGIFGIGSEGECSIYGANQDKTYYEENLIAIGFSAYGDGKIYLDYSECGTDGEPRVIAIDGDDFDNANPKPVVLANNFEAFIKILREYDEEKEADVKFAPDDKIHKLVKKKVLIESNMWIYILMVIVFIISVLGFVFDIFILKLPIAIDILLLFFLVFSSIDTLNRKYSCWYDVVEEIKEENGIKQYILRDTDRKMFFIISKKEQISVGDKFLCTTEGYAFKYDK